MGDAWISECGHYRYQLGRWLTDDRTTLRILFVMLNPSTADAADDDATIRRCASFALAWGFDRLDVANLYALRARDPKEIARVGVRAVGPANDGALAYRAMVAHRIVCAWGAPSWCPTAFRSFHEARVRGVMSTLRVGKVHHLGLTKDGHPRHPLYLPANTAAVPWDDAAPIGAAT